MGKSTLASRVTPLPELSGDPSTGAAGAAPDAVWTATGRDAGERIPGALAVPARATTEYQ